ncbi:asparaginase [Athelia psychrophila]|uniref:Asparaginase n=1 Tax=Athelia psychrophila TaxID=1759441 RepID=A0A166WWY8_9AGAM|nr:asparaginase [Fibularhizoctonia sp. CBS 109695]
MVSPNSLNEKVPLLRIPVSSKKGKYVLVIHGGAGTMDRASSSPAKEAMYKNVLSAALRAGYAVLADGGEAMDAAVAAVTVLEDCPLFNSGKGAVFNVAGKNELESSIMLSKPPSSHPEIPASRRGIGLTLLTQTRNPSQLARAFYLSPALAPHAMLSGASAEETSQDYLGFELVDPSYYYTEGRWKEHRRGLGLSEEPLPHRQNNSQSCRYESEHLDKLPTGTVGAVALDVRGCIAAVTSTGGKTNKLVGRVGDTPQMGSGYWAEEWIVDGWLRKAWNHISGKGRKRAVGVSGTGDGDYFIRLATASTIGRRVRFLHEPLQKAAEWAVEDLRKEGGAGGVIAVDSSGNVAMPLNSSGMYRGVIREDGVPKTAIFDDDVLS